MKKTKKYKKLSKSKAAGETEETKTQQAEFKKKELVAIDELKRSEVEEEMGVSRVIQAMILSGKPFIGHNMIYDVGFIYQQYIADLPETYIEFKTKVHDCFPAIFDTKVIAYNHNNMFTQFDLPHMLRKCVELNKDRIKFVFPIEFKNLELVKEEHNAGFDSYCSGKVFTILTKLIELREISQSSHPFRKSYYIAEDEKKGEEMVENGAGNGSSPGSKADTKKEVKKEPVSTNPQDALSKLSSMLASFQHGSAANSTKKS